MKDFNNAYNGFLAEFGKNRFMVLATSASDKVTARMMSVVRIADCFYFQTDKASRKYRQLISNPNVALCIDNMQIEGICKDIGRPSENAEFCEVFKECYLGSYDKFTMYNNERLLCVQPAFIERWVYKDSRQYIETIDIARKAYDFTEYKDEMM